VPGSISALDIADIRENTLTVQFTPEVIRLVAPTGKDAPKPPSAPALSGCLALHLTKDKKKADIDITGGLQAGENAKPQYFWSVKAQCPFVLGEGARFGEFGPTFTGEASQQRNADPDALKAALTYRKIFAPRGTRDGWIFFGDAVSYEFERSVKKEAVLNEGEIEQQEFLKKNSNLMWSAMLRYVNGSPQLNWSFGLAGFEAGKALSRTVKKASTASNEQLVTRLHFNFDAYRTFFHKGKPAVTFHGHHTVRVPFRQEPFTRTDENGGKMFLTNKPRHWTLVELAFLLTDGAGINVQYKRGSLPPSFEFVDHQVTIGFNLLLKR
jgi:hypothetical protein